MFDELEVDESEGWVELDPPTLKLNTVGVVCETCGKISLLRYHTYRNGFSMRCPACYRAENVRLAQRRYKAHKRKEHEVRLGALKTLLITRIDALIRTNTQKLKMYEVEGTRTLAQRKALERRSKYAVFYAEVRRRILLDIDLGNPKPFAAYINDEELNERVFDTKRLVDGASKTTAVEPQVI